MTISPATTKVISCDIETPWVSEDNHLPEVICLSMSGGPATFYEALAFLSPMAAQGEDIICRFDSVAEEWSVLVGKELAATLVSWAMAVDGSILVTHNGRFDWSCMMAHAPELRPRIIELANEGRLSDTKIREDLFAIASGFFVFDPRRNAKFSASLAACAQVYLNKDRFAQKKDPDSVRYTYERLIGVPLDEWGSEEVNYAIEDSDDTRDVWWAQAEHPDFPEGKVVNDNGMLVNEVEQVAADLVLYDISAYGVMTDFDAVVTFAINVQRDAAAANNAAFEAGFLRINKCKFCEGTGWLGVPPNIGKCAQCEGDPDYIPKGSRVPLKKPTLHRARLQAWVQHCFGGYAPKTDPTSKFPQGQVKTDNETLLGSGHPLLLKYAKGLQAKKLLSTYVPILMAGSGRAILSDPRILVRSGRTSWRRPNLQNPPRTEGFRECFVPRPGMVFASIDYDALELCTVSQACIEFFGYSRLAEAINAGKDPHILLALDLLAAKGIHLDHDEAVKARKNPGHEHHKEVKAARQNAKIGNFGFWGGLGVQSFVVFAKGMGVDMSFNEAQRLRDAWFARWAETKPYFNMISMSSDISGGRFRVKQLYTDRLRGDCTYTSGANTYFQGLAADGAKAALWALYMAMYDEASPMYGVRMWAFIHDEVLFEGPEETAHVWAPEAARIMREEMQRYVPDVKIGAEAALMRRWLKNADPVYDDTGKLIPWEG